jgi:hypothetical protein
MPQTPPATDAKRRQDIERSRERTRLGSDIGEVPGVVDPARRGSTSSVF